MNATTRRYLITAAPAAAMSGAALLGTAPAWGDTTGSSDSTNPFVPEGPPIRSVNNFHFAPSESISVGDSAYLGIKGETDARLAD